MNALSECYGPRDGQAFSFFLLICAGLLVFAAGFVHDLVFKDDSFVDTLTAGTLIVSWGSIGLIAFGFMPSYGGAAGIGLSMAATIAFLVRRSFLSRDWTSG